MHCAFFGEVDILLAPSFFLSGITLHLELRCVRNYVVFRNTSCPELCTYVCGGLMYIADPYIFQFKERGVCASISISIR